MAELHVMDALREKRSELSGVVSRLEQQLVQHRGSLAHLDATMRLFDPDLLSQDTDLPPLRGRVSWFGLGECRRLIYDVLRDAPQPLATRELAERVMAAKGIDAVERAEQQNGGTAPLAAQGGNQRQTVKPGKHAIHDCDVEAFRQSKFESALPIAGEHHVVTGALEPVRDEKRRFRVVLHDEDVQPSLRAGRIHGQPCSTLHRCMHTVGQRELMFRVAAAVTRILRDSAMDETTWLWIGPLGMLGGSAVLFLTGRRGDA